MWIATDEILPDDMQEVLVYDQEKGIYIGHYFGSAKSFIRTLDGTRLMHATYWMPIPNPPIH